MPVSAIVCGDVLAVSVKTKEAERLPAADGANDTLTLQLAPTARLLPQVVLMVKSGALGPLSETLAIASGPAPVLVSVRVVGALAVPTAWLGKVRLDALKLTPADCIPVPLRLTLCGELATESVNIKEAARLPAASGEKVTDTLQLLDAANTLPQVVLIPKSPEFAPVNQMLRILSEAVPVFDRFMV